MNNLAKVPPQATDIEDAIIGALLQDSTAIEQITNIISKESFYSPKNKKI